MFAGIALVTASAPGCSSESPDGLKPEVAQKVEALRAGGAMVEVKQGQITGVDFYAALEPEKSVPLIDGVTSIERLNFSSVEIDDGLLAHLAGLENLDHLSLNDTPIGDEGVAHLAGLARLRVLNLDGTAVSDAALADIGRLSNLEGLALYRTRVTDAGLEELAKLDRLQWLRLSGPGVTAEGVQTLEKQLEETQISYHADPSSIRSQYGQ